MNNQEVYNDIKELFHNYRIGDVVKEPISISGGLLHKMFQVSSKTKVYAVKWLNPTLMQRDGVLKNMIHSEVISNVFSKYVPVVTAITVDGQNVFLTNDKYYMVFPWMEGTSVFPPFIREEHCYKIGSSLGRMHQLNITIPEVYKDNHDSTIYQWHHFLHIAKEQEAYWLDSYAKTIEKLVDWNNHMNEANDQLKEFMVISHRDLDPKNVMWHQDTPYLIDWEAAGYVNPYQELLEVLNYWTTSGNGELDQAKFNLLLKAYNESMSTKNVDWDCVLNSGYAGMLGWLEYSLKRALGIESKDQAEIVLGAEQVLTTINELERYDKQLMTLKKWFREWKD